MSTIRVDNISTGSLENQIPLSELRHRVIKSTRSAYNGGSWQPSTTFQWAPYAFLDYTPNSASSRIRFTIALTMAHTNGHAISHCIFYANNIERGRHSISGQSPEHRHTYVWDFPSWGTSNARIGYQIRNYGTSNQARFHSTHHWNGAGNNQNAQSEIILEEYFPIP
jgi:hypothetical protein